MALPTMALTSDLTRCFACRTGYEAVSHAWRGRPAPQSLQDRKPMRVGHANSAGNFRRSGCSAHHSRYTARISIAFSFHYAGNRRQEQLNNVTQLKHIQTAAENSTTHTGSTQIKVKSDGYRQVSTKRHKLKQNSTSTVEKT